MTEPPGASLADASSQVLAQDERRCPHCGGTIKVAARVCKHCREDVAPVAPASASPTRPMGAMPGPTRIFFRALKLPHTIADLVDGDDQARFVTMLGAILMATFLVPRGAGDSGIAMAWNLVSAVGATWVTTIFPFVAGAALVVAARTKPPAVVMAVVLLVGGLTVDVVRAGRQLLFDPNLLGLITCAHDLAAQLWFGIAGVALVGGRTRIPPALRLVGVVASAVYLSYLVVPTYGTASSSYTASPGLAVPFARVLSDDPVGGAWIGFVATILLMSLVPLGIALQKRQPLWRVALFAIWASVVLSTVIAPSWLALRSVLDSIWVFFGTVVVGVQDVCAAVATFAGLLLLSPMPKSSPAPAVEEQAGVGKLWMKEIALFGVFFVVGAVVPWVLIVLIDSGWLDGNALSRVYHDISYAFRNQQPGVVLVAAIMLAPYAIFLAIRAWHHRRAARRAGSGP